MSAHVADFPGSTRHLATADFPGELEIPGPLQANVERHPANLAQLIRSLQRAGIDKRQIDAFAEAVVASYRTELLLAIECLVKGDDV